MVKRAIVEILRKFHQALEKEVISVTKVILHGSRTSGKFHRNSDIDIAITSTSFTGDRFEDRRRIVPLRRKIDNRIEPIPFRPEDFSEGGILVDAIKKTGITLQV